MRENTSLFTTLLGEVDISAAQLWAKRSRLNARALRRQQLRQNATQITATLNDVYGAQASHLHSAWSRLQSEHLLTSKW